MIMSRPFRILLSGLVAAIGNEWAITTTTTTTTTAAFVISSSSSIRCTRPLFMKPTNKGSRRRPPPQDDNNNNNNDNNDPWAGYRVSTDDDDEDQQKKKEDDATWLSKLGLSQQVIDNLPPKQGAPIPQLPRDDFFQPFDEEKFSKIKQDYQKTKQPSAPPIETYGATTAESLSLETATYPTPKVSPFSTLVEHNQYQLDYYQQKNLFSKLDKNKLPLIKHMAKRSITQLKKSIYEGIDQRNGWKIPNRPNESYPTVLKILDVGCGTAEYWTYLLEAANEQRVTLDLTGIDLVSESVDHVNKIIVDAALDEQGGRHLMKAQSQDVFSLLADNKNKNNDENTYHAVLLHNTWSNLWNTTLFLNQVTDLLVIDGILYVGETEYDGNDGSRRNNQENPSLFPGVLPSIVDMRRVLRTLPLAILDASERIDLIGSSSSSSSNGGSNSNSIVTYDWYSVSLVRTVHRALSDIARFRGIVINGFGRGSKQLGFPTANIGPSSIFQSALEYITTLTQQQTSISSPSSTPPPPPRGGVYFGWAVLEDATARKKGRNTYHRAVVNIGFSPTFVGMENPERTVEAYLILEDDENNNALNSDLTRMVPSDFYGETMRLQLHGYLRPEQKFDSLASLISQISTDVECTKNALRLQPFAALRSDVFLVDPCRRINNTLTSGQDYEPWIGKGGGNATASWEFQDITSTLKATPLGMWVV